MRRDGCIPEKEYSTYSEEKQRRFQSTTNLHLCEDHFDLDQFNCPADKGWSPVAYYCSFIVLLLVHVPFSNFSRFC